MKQAAIQLIAFFPWIVFVLEEKPSRYASLAERIFFFVSAMALFFVARFCAAYMTEMTA